MRMKRITDQHCSQIIRGHFASCMSLLKRTFGIFADLTKDVPKGQRPPGGLLEIFERQLNRLEAQSIVVSKLNTQPSLSFFSHDTYRKALKKMRLTRRCTAHWLRCLGWTRSPCQGVSGHSHCPPTTSTASHTRSLLHSYRSSRLFRILHACIRPGNGPSK